MSNANNGDQCASAQQEEEDEEGVGPDDVVLMLFALSFNVVRVNLHKCSRNLGFWHPLLSRHALVIFVAVFVVATLLAHAFDRLLVAKFGCQLNLTTLRFLCAIPHRIDAIRDKR